MQFYKDDFKHTPILKLEGNEQHSFLAKHYFSDYPVAQRKQIIANFYDPDIRKFNIKLHDFVIQIEKKNVQELPKLVNSIILNSLAYEANEELEKTLYKDYKDKRVSKYKGFVDGQYMIYRNIQEQLFEIAEEDLQENLLLIDKIISLISSIGTKDLDGLDSLLRAYEIDSKRVDGIVRVILKKESQQKPGS